jgi:hypothetical protein
MDKQDTVNERERDAKNPQVTKSSPETNPGVTHTESSDMPLGRAQGMVTGAVAATEQVGSGMVGGVTNIATDLVHGVGTVGGEVVAVVRDTANTAIAGVGSVGETAVHTVTGLLADLVGGLRDIGSAAVRGRGETTDTLADRDAQARLTAARHGDKAAHEGRP